MTSTLQPRFWSFHVRRVRYICFSGTPLTCTIAVQKKANIFQKVSDHYMVSGYRSFKGKCYGHDPVVISLQLTHFQSLISLRMNHLNFREDPKSHLPVSRTCTFLSTAKQRDNVLGSVRPSIGHRSYQSQVFVCVSSYHVCRVIALMWSIGLWFEYTVTANGMNDISGKNTFPVKIFSGLCQKTLFYHFLFH